MSKSVATEFSPQSIAVLTISDSRTETSDKSGRYLTEALGEAGHKVYDKQILPDHKYRIRALLSHWIAAAEVRVIITTGGTGFADRDITPEAVQPLLDKQIPGFGELFRQVSIGEIGTSALQSRALAGVANGAFIFCLPGSVNACRTAWEKILKQQLDIRNRPCNFIELFPRIGQEL